jgi:hypothetical protein
VEGVESMCRVPRITEAESKNIQKEMIAISLKPCVVKPRSCAIVVWIIQDRFAETGNQETENCQGEFELWKLETDGRDEIT